MAGKSKSGNTEWITSRQNPLISFVRRISGDRRFRRENGLFLCDGRKMLDEALKWEAEIEVVISTPAAEIAVLPGVRNVQVPPELMNYISPMQTPQGVLFICRMASLEPPKVFTGSRYLVLDGLQDPGNVGTIWRTADAFGADGLLLTESCADPYNPKTVRATMGAVFRLPVYELTLEKLTELCRNADLPLYSTALREDSLPLNLCSLSRAAVIIGNEGSGVSPEMIAASEKTLRIPMESRCESLNAASAAAVILWEMYQQSGKA